MNRKSTLFSSGIAFAFLALTLLVSVVLIHHRTVASPNRLLWNDYGFSELLINYDGGFVRRGLLGTLLKQHDLQGSALPAINQLLFGNYLLLTLLLLILSGISKKLNPLPMLLAVTVPGGIFAMAISNQVFYRKEVFFYSALCFSSCLLLLSRRFRNTTARRFVAALTLLCVFVLGLILTVLHEGFFFLSAPASALLILGATRILHPAPDVSREPLRWTKRAVYTYAGIIGSAFLIMSFFKGNKRVAEKIWYGVSASDKLMCGGSERLPGALVSLGRSVTQNLLAAKSVEMSGMAWYWIAAMVVGFLYCLSMVSLYGEKDSAGSTGSVSRWTICYLSLAICALPMYLLGADWGRWIISTNLSFLIVWFSLTDDDLQAASRLSVFRGIGDRSWMQRALVVVRTESVVFESFVQRHRRAAVIVLLLFSFSFRIPESALVGTGDWILSRFGTDLNRMIHMAR